MMYLYTCPTLTVNIILHALMLIFLHPLLHMSSCRCAYVLSKACPSESLIPVLLFPFSKYNHERCREVHREHREVVSVSITTAFPRLCTVLAGH